MKQIYKLLLLIPFVLCWGINGAQAQEMAAVGYYTENGQIELVDEVFVDSFEDGTEVVEVKLQRVDDFIYVARKGYSEDGDCRTEIAPLVNQFGHKLTVGSDPAMCQKVYLKEFQAVRLMSCEDEGCHFLKGITTLDGEPLVKDAYCDSSELSENKCRCHINKGLGEEVASSEGLCKSSFNGLDLQLAYWVNRKVAAKIHTIDHCASN